MSTSCSSSSASNSAQLVRRPSARDARRRSRRSAGRLPWCRDGARASAGVSGPGRRAWGPCSETSALIASAASSRANNQLMRPEILNPLFAEVEALKGVGPQLAKLLEKLGLSRVVDLALSSADRGRSSGSERRRRRAAAARPQRHRRADAVRQPRQSRSGRGPMRVYAADGDGNTISLVYFGNPGWAKRSAADGRAAHGLGQARAVWRGMADRPSRGGRAGQGAAAGRSASRSIR